MFLAAEIRLAHGVPLLLGVANAGAHGGRLGLHAGRRRAQVRAAALGFHHGFVAVREVAGRHPFAAGDE